MSNQKDLTLERLTQKAIDGDIEARTRLIELIQQEDCSEREKLAMRLQILKAK